MKKVLMCGSELSVKGGMVSVIKNYLNYDKWNDITITFIPTHTEKNKFVVALYFFVSYFKVIVTAVFGKHDVFYLHTAERGSFYRKSMLLRTLRKFGIKTVMHHHAAEFEEFYEGLSEGKKRYVKNTLQLADLNIVLSENLVTMITDKAPKANVKVLYNAVPTYDFNPYNRNARNILFLGRLGERKGTYDLIEAIEKLDSLIDGDICFYLCGDGEVENVKELINQKGLKHRINYIGWIDMKKKRDVFERSMINVLPSYNEGLPMTILETMAYGIPNISTNIASIPEVIKSGENGFLIEPGDVEMLSKYIQLLCQNEGLRETMSNRAWMDINSKFAMDAHIELLTKYLNEL